MIDIQVENLSKCYRVASNSREQAAASRGLLDRVRGLRKRYSDFWAVRNLNFQVETGEAVGVIGHNGAGKSTLLKMLSNITKPTAGRIVINGRLSSLIEVGSGFHQELTGRENIYLSGSILGMKRREIAAKFDSIVEFAEIARFIDTPVKYYSSGMYVRLGFAIAAHLDPDVLLLDEVLAVGDAVFQAKCIQRVTELRDAGTTILFISHDLGAVEKLCTRVILMKRGEAIADGDPHSVIEEYQRAGFVPTQPRLLTAEFNSRRVQIKNVTFHDVKGSRTSTFTTGNPLFARISYAAREPLPNAYVEMFFKGPDGQAECQMSTKFSGSQLDIDGGEGEIEFACEELGLQPGLYGIDVAIDQFGALEGVDWLVDCASVQVIQGKVANGRFYMPHSWRHSAGVTTTASDQAGPSVLNASTSRPTARE